MYANTRIIRNSSWENWGSYGLAFGFFLIIIGILTQIFEFPRVYNGVTNVNIINNNKTDGLYKISNYYNHWWPWTYAANLFGLFTFITGIVGVLAGLRGTYTSIFGFFTMTVTSALFSIYLIIYFAFIISLYGTLGKNISYNRTQVESVSYGLACTQLVIASINAIISIFSAILAGRAIALCVNKGVSDDDIMPYNLGSRLPPREESSASHGLSCEPNPLPLSTSKHEFDVNYEHMIENLLLQQVLLYTRERTNPSYNSRSRRSRSTTTTNNSLHIQQQQTKSYNIHNNKHLVLTSSTKHKNIHNKEPTLCLIESNEEASSSLIENILYYYNQNKDEYTRFDQNLIDLLLKRNHERKNLSTCKNSGFYYRLQWLAIGLVIDRFFFYIYFTATLISYFITLCLIPLSHPNLAIDIHSL